jgi:hypothetical protein
MTFEKYGIKLISVGVNTQRVFDPSHKITFLADLIQRSVFAFVHPHFDF